MVRRALERMLRQHAPYPSIVMDRCWNVLMTNNSPRASSASTVGTPHAIALQELRVECMFPADNATEAWHLETFGTA